MNENSNNEPTEAQIQARIAELELEAAKKTPLEVAESLGVVHLLQDKINPTKAQVIEALKKQFL